MGDSTTCIYKMPDYNTKAPGHRSLCVFQIADGSILVGRYDATLNIFVVPTMMPGGDDTILGCEVLRWRPAVECL